MDPVATTPALTVLADPTRARILRLIRDAEDGRARVGRLADELGLRQPTVSHHMRALHDEGIVIREPEGRRVWYSISPAHVDRIDSLLGDRAAVVNAGEPDLDRVVADLADRYAGVINRQTVGRYVQESHDLLAARENTPLLASRTAAFAAQRLDDLLRRGQREQREQREQGVPEVLFVCVENAGRSQLAAGILRQLAGDRVLVRTAGSAPARDLRASIVTALDEIGVPVGGEFPKPLTDEAVRAADYVITMGCGDACPIYPGRRYLDWDIDDPAGKPLSVVRGIRDDIERRVRDLLPALINQ
ncbi:metalloregulator ArsR/SmtB family transcription factor [Microbacterium immunditiarum]|uniref:ArsR family transcriptional regulator n=1 Tax=Microbacterium immunditiarum TaxID=337480 RepID=A0A7Y9KJA5_9MICO|nr:metalloregulator ArsR/SmtB family transcription factor [Microbacterium immunditiarum]NYE19446.1 ArsR family transcriptional regulator [Microbacterium immunditiarum]